MSFNKAHCGECLRGTAQNSPQIDLEVHLHELDLDIGALITSAGVGAGRLAQHHSVEVACAQVYQRSSRG